MSVAVAYVIPERVETVTYNLYKNVISALK